MKSSRRYCRRCKIECLHDHVKEAPSGAKYGSLGERTIVGIFTMGMSVIADAVLYDDFYKCQRCGKLSER